MRGSLPRRGLTLSAVIAEEEPNRYCSVGGNGLKLYSNGRLLVPVVAAEPARYRLRATWSAWQRRAFHCVHPLPACGQGPNYPVHCRSCVFREKPH